MLNYKANSLSSVIPKKIYENNPRLQEFLSIYYEWQYKTTVHTRGGVGVGNLNLSSKVKSTETNVNADIEAVISSSSFVTEFDEVNTFIVDEKIWSYIDLSDSLELTLSSSNDYLLNNIKKTSITLFRGFSYNILNNTSESVYIKFAKTIGTDEQLSTVQNNGSDSGIITIDVNESAPNFLFLYSSSGSYLLTIKVEYVPELYNIVETNVSPLFFTIVKNIFFHTEYLYQVFEGLNSPSIPNALFQRYAESYGLDTFFRNNFRFKSFFDNFVEFFRQRGTNAGIKYFFRNFFDTDVQLDFPGERVLRSSQSDFFSFDELFVSVEYAGPLTSNQTIVGDLSKAEATIEAYSYDTNRDYYKLFLKRSKTTASFQIGESFKVKDDDEPSIRYEVGGQVLGNISNIEIVEPGNEYTVGQTISDSFTFGGITSQVDVRVDAVRDSPISRIRINSPGEGYEVNDEVIFVKPEKRTKFSGIVQPDPNSGEDKYTSTEIGIIFEDLSEYQPIDFTNATFRIDATPYIVNSYTTGSPDVITVQSDTTPNVTPTVKSGQPITFDVLESNVTDPYFDVNGVYFQPSNTTVKRGARGYITSVTASGAIEDIFIQDRGYGYIKRPNTLDDSIQIITTSGNSADLEVIGSNFGSIESLTKTNDTVGAQFTETIELDKGGPADDNAKISLVVGPFSQYGNFFRGNQGFISDDIYIHDSLFYQDYSYVIQSDLNISDFATLLKELAHPAGMIFFNQFFITRVFSQKLNQGSEIPNVFRTITINKELVSPLLLIGTLIVDVVPFLTSLRTKQILNKFRWFSETPLELDNVASDLNIATASGTTVSGYKDVTLKDETLINRDSDETHFQTNSNLFLETTVSGAGTVSYAGTTSGVSYEGFATMSGTSTSFLSAINTQDIIKAEGESFWVHKALTDTELIVQRLNTNGPVSITNSIYTIDVRRNTKLENANYTDILYFGDNITFSGDSGEFTFQELNEIPIN